MTPRFAAAVDPIFLHVLGLLDRIARGESRHVQEERASIRALIDQAGAKLGGGQQWELAKYALVCWIDEVLIEAPWDGREWWNNNVLEVDLFKMREAAERFFFDAKEASTLPQRDALEVFYVCVILGFRGLYRDPDGAMGLTQARNLPADLDTWVRQTSLAIHLGQGRPVIADGGAPGEGAPPLHGQSFMVWAVLTGVLLSAVTFAIAIFWTLQSRVS
jgi:type VI secretion system protein ImpK